jgi:Fur family ferric uptake transcriptional regulator
MNSDTVDLLHTMGLKNTPFRLELFQLLHRAKKPLTAAEILNSLKKNTVDKVTLYRNLEMLEEKGVLCRHYFNEQEAKYELRDEPHHHHHMICNSCHVVQDVPDCHFPPTASVDGFDIQHHHVEFFGLCKKCQ